MKKLTVLCCVILCANSTIQAQKWHSDFEEAKKIALEKNKKIIVVFQGSDWNGLCIRLNKEIWTNMEFQKYAKENYVMVKADFPRRKENILSKERLEKNNKLADIYNRDRVFPLVAVVDKQGELLGTTGYKKVAVHQYIELLNFFKSTNE